MIKNIWETYHFWGMQVFVTSISFPFNKLSYPYGWHTDIPFQVPRRSFFLIWPDWKIPQRHWQNSLWIICGKLLESESSMDLLVGLWAASSSQCCRRTNTRSCFQIFSNCHCIYFLWKGTNGYHTFVQIMDLSKNSQTQIIIVNFVEV